jgi:hypothetical protein
MKPEDLVVGNYYRWTKPPASSNKEPFELIKKRKYVASIRSVSQGQGQYNIEYLCAMAEPDVDYTIRMATKKEVAEWLNE